MKQDVAVISLDACAEQFTPSRSRSCSASGSPSAPTACGTVPSSTCPAGTTSIWSPPTPSTLGDLHQYVPIDGEMMEIHVTLRWDVVRRLQSLPAGKRALFVNLSDKMCREAVTRLNQLGVNRLVFDLLPPRRAGAGYGPV